MKARFIFWSATNEHEYHEGPKAGENFEKLRGQFFRHHESFR